MCTDCIEETQVQEKYSGMQTCLWRDFLQQVPEPKWGTLVVSGTLFKWGAFPQNILCRIRAYINSRFFFLHLCFMMMCSQQWFQRVNRAKEWDKVCSWCLFANWRHRNRCWYLGDCQACFLTWAVPWFLCEQKQLSRSSLLVLQYYLNYWNCTGWFKLSLNNRAYSGFWWIP